MVQYGRRVAAPGLHATEQSDSIQRPGGAAHLNLDSTLGKQFRITERVRFELRFEAYNTLNKMTLADPVTSITSPNFGKVIDERTGFYGRQIQFSGHLTF